MGLKEQAVIFKVNEYLKKPEIRKLLVGKIVEASKDPEFKEFLKEDVEEVLRENHGAVEKIPEPHRSIFIKKNVPQDSIEKAAKDVLKELEKEVDLKQKHISLGSKFIETILQTKLLNFRFSDLYLRQRSFAWISSVTAVCFLLAVLTKMNDQIGMSKIFLGVGTGLIAGGFLTYYFLLRTYKDIFAK